MGKIKQQFGKVRYVSTGQRFRPRAGEWNAMAEAANAHRQQSVGSSGIPLSFPLLGDEIFVLNSTVKSGEGETPVTTADYWMPGDVVILHDKVFDPSIVPAPFQHQRCMTGLRATDQDAGRTFAIVSEPIRPGAIGRAKLLGVFSVKVAINSLGDTTAGPATAEVLRDRDRYRMASGSGAATLLWVQPEEDRDERELTAAEQSGLSPDEIAFEKKKFAWCYVQIGASGASIVPGVIVTESAVGAADNFEDNRYWVELGACADTGDAPLAFTGNGTVVEATNIHENTTGWHGLRAGTQVALLRVGAGYLIL